MIQLRLGYTPAHVHQVLWDLEAFEPFEPGLKERDPVRWVREHRGNHGSRLQLDLRPRGYGGTPMGFETDLPPFARAANGTIW